MTPAARLQAAIEVLDEVIASTRDDGPPADSIVTRYFKHRRYAGSKDRRAVRELVFRAIRRSAERPMSGRSTILGLAHEEPALLDLFGESRGPEPLRRDEIAAPAGVIPDWLRCELSPLVGADEWTALLERAPLDLRVNISRTSREEMLEAVRPYVQGIQVNAPFGRYTAAAEVLSSILPHAQMPVVNQSVSS